MLAKSFLKRNCFAKMSSTSFANKSFMNSITKRLPLASQNLSKSYIFLNSRRFAHSEEKEKISVLFYAPDGQKRKVEGYVGETITECARRNGAYAVGRNGCQGIDDGGEFSEGPVCNACHVKIGKTWESKLPKISSMEENNLYWLPHYMETDGSRLACFIRLTKEMDGIGVGMLPPHKTGPE